MRPVINYFLNMMIDVKLKSLVSEERLSNNLSKSHDAKKLLNACDIEVKNSISEIFIKYKKINEDDFFNDCLLLKYLNGLFRQSQDSQVQLLFYAMSILMFCPIAAEIRAE